MASLRLLALLALLPVAALAAGTDSPPFKAALELYTSRRDAEAEAAFQALVAADARHDAALYYLGRLAKRARNWDKTVEYFERCTQIDPRNAVYWADLGEAYGKQAKRASVFRQLSLANKCRKALEQAVALAPDNLEFRDGLISYYLEAPGIAGGGADKALAQAREIAARDAFHAALATGRIQLHEKDWVAAERAYQEAAKLKPGHLDPPFALGQLYAQLGRFDEAFRIFEDLLLQNPQNFGALYQVGRTAALSGLRLDRGETTLRIYLSQPQRAANLPTHAQANVRLGEILAHRRDTAGARACFEEALRQDPGLKEAAEALKKLK